MVAKPSIYLLPSEYETYGLPPTTTEAQVIRASAIIDGYLDRPEGLIYTLDVLGLPAVMAKTGKPIYYIENVPFRGRLFLTSLPLVAIKSVESSNGLLNNFYTLRPDQFSFSQSGYLALNVWVWDRTEIAIEYIAGWTYEDLPSDIKQAVANIILAFGNADTPIVSGNIRRLQAGNTSITWNGTSGNNSIFSSIYIDGTTAAILAPYKRVVI